MRFSAIHRYAHISPHKVKGVVELIRGRHVNDALQILRGTPKRAATLVDKVLRSAMANADQSLEADMQSLHVVEARVETGPTMRRWSFRARGRLCPIRKRSSHISIVLDDGR